MMMKMKIESNANQLFLHYQGTTNKEREAVRFPFKYYILLFSYLLAIAACAAANLAIGTRNGEQET